MKHNKYYKLFNKEDKLIPVIDGFLLVYAKRKRGAICIRHLSNTYTSSTTDYYFTNDVSSYSTSKYNMKLISTFKGWNYTIEEIISLFEKRHIVLFNNFFINNFK